MRTLRRVNESLAVPIVGDGAIAHPDIGEGRIIPVLIIDCTNHQQLHQLIILHDEVATGDVKVTWSTRLLNKSFAYLTLEFSKPAIVDVLFRFELKKYAGFIDGIIQSKGLYLQPSSSGKKVIHSLDSPKILLEIPSSATFPGWGELYLSTLVKLYKKNGAEKKQAKNHAMDHIQRNSELWSKRMKDK